MYNNNKKLKSFINKKFKELEKYNFKVFNLSYNSFLPKGLKGFVDYIVIGNGYIYLIELKLKLTNDKLTKEQKDLIEHIKRQRFNEVKYILMNEENVEGVIDLIITSKK